MKWHDATLIRPEHSAALQEKVERLRLEPGPRETERFG